MTLEHRAVVKCIIALPFPTRMHHRPSTDAAPPSKPPPSLSLHAVCWLSSRCAGSGELHAMHRCTPSIREQMGGTPPLRVRWPPSPEFKTGIRMTSGESERITRPSPPSRFSPIAGRDNSARVRVHRVAPRTISASSASSESTLIGWSQPPLRFMRYVVKSHVERKRYATKAKRVISLYLSLQVNK